MLTVFWLPGFVECLKHINFRVLVFGLEHTHNFFQRLSHLVLDELENIVGVVVGRCLVCTDDVIGSHVIVIVIIVFVVIIITSDQLDFRDAVYLEIGKIWEIITIRII